MKRIDWLMDSQALILELVLPIQMPLLYYQLLDSIPPFAVTKGYLQDGFSEWLNMLVYLY